jgi:hypothetical protein
LHIKECFTYFFSFYIKRFEYYLHAAGTTKDERKKALLLHLGEEELQDIRDINQSKKFFRQEKQHSDQTEEDYICKT